MRPTMAWIVGLALVALAASVGVAQTVLIADETEGIQIPVKGRIDARDGDLRLTFRVYNAARGGSVLYTESRAVSVVRGIYFAMVGGRGLPVTAGRSLWVEVATAGGRILGGRQAFAVSTSSDDLTPSAIDPMVVVKKPTASLCLTCGGTWPVFSGAFTQGLGENPTERDVACAGVLGSRADTRPFLCTRKTP